MTLSQAAFRTAEAERLTALLIRHGIWDPVKKEANLGTAAALIDTLEMTLTIEKNKDPSSAFITTGQGRTVDLCASVLYHCIWTSQKTEGLTASEINKILARIFDEPTIQSAKDFFMDLRSKQ